MKHHISESKFRHRNPSVTRVEYGVVYIPLARIQAKAYDDGGLIAVATGKTSGEALYDLSARILSLHGREVADDQGWKDANLGTVEPLSGHHKVKRSAHRDDSKSNLAGLGLRTHSLQHEK